MDPGTRAWTRMVAQLALMPSVSARLIAVHTSDERGLCRACTTPGRGTPRTPWPCGPAAIAFAAQRFRDKQLRTVESAILEASGGTEPDAAAGCDLGDAEAPRPVRRVAR